MSSSCCHDNNHTHKKDKKKMIETFCERLNYLKNPNESEAVSKIPQDDSWMRNVQKRILHAGKGFPFAESCQRQGGGYEYPKETKFIFNYQIKTVEPNGVEPVIMDDTKKYGKTMEVYSGKKFQLEWWEHCLSTMAIDEVASFRVPPERLLNFAPVNKKLRDYMLGKSASGQATHCCGGMLAMQEFDLGYEDLNKFLKNPKTLDFIFELISVDLPEDNKKEAWILNEEERLAKIPILRERGNELYSTGKFKEASDAYKEALHFLEQLSLKEKPQEPEWHAIDSQRVPFFLNLAQCQFKLKDYYGSIESCNEAINRDANSVKALYRRAQSYASIWEIDSALKDYQAIISLKPEMELSISKEMNELRNRWTAQDEKDKNLLSNRLKMKL